MHAAAAWSQTTTPAAAEQVFRFLPERGLLALASFCAWPFEVLGFGPESAAVLDVLVCTPARARAYQDAQERLEALLPALRRDPEYEPGSWEPRPLASALWARLHQGEVRLAWAGGDLAALVRGGQIVARSAPHVLAQQAIARHPNRPPPEHVAWCIPTRLIAPRADVPFGAERDPETASWLVQPGDRLLLLSNEALPRVEDSDLIEASAMPSPTDAAEHLVERARPDKPHRGLAVVAAFL